MLLKVRFWLVGGRYIVWVIVNCIFVKVNIKFEYCLSGNYCFIKRVIYYEIN